MSPGETKHKSCLYSLGKDVACLLVVTCRHEGFWPRCHVRRLLALFPVFLLQWGRSVRDQVVRRITHAVLSAARALAKTRATHKHCLQSIADLSAGQGIVTRL